MKKNSSAYKAPYRRSAHKGPGVWGLAGAADVIGCSRTHISDTLTYLKKHKRSLIPTMKKPLGGIKDQWWWPNEDQVRSWYLSYKDVRAANGHRIRKEFDASEVRIPAFQVDREFYSQLCWARDYFECETIPETLDLVLHRGIAELKEDQEMSNDE